MIGSLDGIRVLELGRYLAGPVTGSLLADLGAEVIRVERPGGGHDRLEFGLTAPCGDTYVFVNINRNKKSVTLNFERNNKGREILKELVKHSDVVTQNFAPMTAEAINITYEDFKKIKPDIIYAQVSGFGYSGPYRNRLCFDPVVRAMAGIMAISGFPGSPPTREQVPWVDYLTASFAAVGVLAALYYRKETGKGQMIDATLLQTAIFTSAPYIAEWEVAGMVRGQPGNQAHWVGPSNLYKAKDGRWVFLTIVTNSIWKRFCRFIDREDIATDSRFQNEVDRWEHRDIIDTIVSEWVASLTADEVIVAAEKIPIPAGICLGQTEVANDPQVKAQKMLINLPASDSSCEVVASNTPIMMSETPLEIKRSFPAIGQYNEEIYCGLLGYRREDLRRFKEEGVI